MLSLLVRRPTSVKTCDFFLCDLQRHRKTTYLFLTLNLFISSFPFLFSPPLSCVSNTFQLSHNNALTSSTDGNAFLLTCILSAPLLYPSLSLLASGTVSLWSTKQILFIFTFTFTFMHLADAFIQSDLHCIQVTVSTFYQLLLSLGIEPMILALLAPCSTS